MFSSDYQIKELHALIRNQDGDD